MASELELHEAEETIASLQAQLAEAEARIAAHRATATPAMHTEEMLRATRSALAAALASRHDQRAQVVELADAAAVLLALYESVIHDEYDGTGRMLVAHLAKGDRMRAALAKVGR